MSDPSPAPESRPPRSSVHFGVTCAEEFAEDERLLRRGGPAVRVAVLADVAVSIGVAVREDAPYLARARSAGVAVVRRTSGGSGVLHGPGDLTWSVVIPRTDPNAGADFVHGYARLGAGVVRFLDRQGVKAAWVAPPDLVPDYCVLSARGQVLAAGPRVLGGAAQHVSRSALLHQGMVPLDVDRDLVRRIFGFSGPVLTERLAGLREFGVSTPVPDLAHQLATELARDFKRSGG